MSELLPSTAEMSDGDLATLLTRQRHMLGQAQSEATEAWNAIQRFYLSPLLGLTEFWTQARRATANARLPADTTASAARAQAEVLARVAQFRIAADVRDTFAGILDVLAKLPRHDLQILQDQNGAPGPSGQKIRAVMSQHPVLAAWQRRLDQMMFEEAEQRQAAEAGFRAAERQREQATRERTAAARALVQRLGLSGITLAVRGRKIEARPADALTPSDLHDIAEHRAGLLDLLGAAPSVLV